MKKATKKRPMTLATSRFSAKALIVASGLSPVRTSIGGPRWPLGYELAGACKLVMPTRAMLKLPIEEYEPLYLAILDGHGVEKIMADLEAIRPEGSPGLVLLCFEDLSKPGQWCHRAMLSRWLEGKTGQAVPELAAAPKAVEKKLF